MTAAPLVFDFASLAAHLDGRLDKLEATLNKRLDAQDAKFSELQGSITDIRNVTKEYFDPSDDETDGDNVSSASEPDEDLDDDDDDDDEISDESDDEAGVKKEKKTKPSDAPLVHPDDAEEAAELQEQLTNMMSGIRKSPLATALPQATAAANGRPASAPTGSAPTGGAGAEAEDEDEEPRIVEEDMEVNEVNDVENFAAEYIDDDGEPVAERRARVAAWQKEKAELDKEEVAQKALKQAKAEAEQAKAMGRAKAGNKYWENSAEREAQRAPKGPYRAHFPEGTSMQIVGLKSRSDLNGSEGTLISFDTYKARWTVKMDQTGEQIMVKEDNLTLLGDGVELPSHDFEVDDLVSKAMGNMKGTVPQMPDPD